MPFDKRNKYGKGGKRKGAGRPTKTKREIKKEAAIIAKEFIETHIQSFLKSYLKLGTGKKLDPATVRHAIDKFVPPRAAEDAKGRTPPAMYYLHPPLESDGSDGDGTW